jgi:hypothetical protein
VYEALSYWCIAALLASPLPGLQRAVVATLHTASASSGKEEKLFQVSCCMLYLTLETLHTASASSGKEEKLFQVHA